MISGPFVYDILLQHVYCRTIMTRFVINLLRWVIVSSTVGFFVSFALTVQMTKFEPIELSDEILIMFVNRGGNSYCVGRVN